MLQGEKAPPEIRLVCRLVFDIIEILFPEEVRMLVQTFEIVGSGLYAGKYQPAGRAFQDAGKERVTSGITSAENAKGGKGPSVKDGIFFRLQTRGTL